MSQEGNSPNYKGLSTVGRENEDDLLLRGLDQTPPEGASERDDSYLELMRSVMKDAYDDYEVARSGAAQTRTAIGQRNFWWVSCLDPEIKDVGNYLVSFQDKIKLGGSITFLSGRPVLLQAFEDHFKPREVYYAHSDEDYLEDLEECLPTYGCKRTLCLLSAQTTLFGEADLFVGELLDDYLSLEGSARML